MQTRSPAWVDVSLALVLVVLFFLALLHGLWVGALLSGGFFTVRSPRLVSGVRAFALGEAWDSAPVRSLLPFAAETQLLLAIVLVALPIAIWQIISNNWFAAGVALSLFAFGVVVLAAARRRRPST
jgi:hypothetical protein